MRFPNRLISWIFGGVAYFRNLLKSGHGSVFEHAVYSFMFHGVSRVFTHELVRHRVGTAISQESLRFVRLTSIDIRILKVLEPMAGEAEALVQALETFQRVGATRLGIDKPDAPFRAKKKATSALRRLAPMSLSTELMWTANVRTLRHVITMRTAVDAEEEIRLVFDRVASIMIAECPLLFGDFKRLRNGEWKPRYIKV